MSRTLLAFHLLSLFFTGWCETPHCPSMATSWKADVPGKASAVSTWWRCVQRPSEQGQNVQYPSVKLLGRLLQAAARSGKRHVDEFVGLMGRREPEMIKENIQSDKKSNEFYGLMGRSADALGSSDSRHLFLKEETKPEKK